MPHRSAPRVLAAACACVLVAFTLGCGPMRLAPPGIAGAWALGRRSTPPWGAYPVAVLAFRLKNASPRAMRTVKITYEVKVLPAGSEVK